jgi:hypothetical protein
MRFITRAAVVRILVLGALLCVLGAAAHSVMVRMPGQSWEGPPAPLNASQVALRDRLRSGVTKLAGEIGERNTGHYEALGAARDWLHGALRSAGYDVERQSYDVSGKRCDNLMVERTGSGQRDEIVVIGAHYDSARGSPGANDNGTGAVAVLELARTFAGAKPTRTLRFVEFVNEEPPHFTNDTMGSRVYARRARERGENIVAMVSVETIGYFVHEPGSQKYPMPLLGLVYPTHGNFISFVGNIDSRDLVRLAVGAFRSKAQVASEGGALPAAVPGVGWSDHSSFWAVGYPALMISDTAPYRYPHYHEHSDTPEQVDFDTFARVVDGLDAVVRTLAGA